MGRGHKANGVGREGKAGEGIRKRPQMNRRRRPTTAIVAAPTPAAPNPAAAANGWVPAGRGPCRVTTSLRLLSSPQRIADEFAGQHRISNGGLVVWAIV